MCNKCGGGMKCNGARIARALAIIGGINWGLVGIGHFIGGANLNLVNMILGSFPGIEALVYILVGIAAVSMIFTCKCKACGTGGTCGTCSATDGAQAPMQM